MFGRKSLEGKEDKTIAGGSRLSNNRYELPLSLWALFLGPEQKTMRDLNWHESKSSEKRKTER